MASGTSARSPAKETEETEDDRQEVLLLRLPSPHFDAALGSRFRLLRPSTPTPLPRVPFLAAHAGGSVRALVISAYRTLDAATLDLLPALRCVVTTSVGVDNIDLAACARRGVAVANVGNIYAADVADYAVGLLIDVLLRVSAAGCYVQGGMWPVAGDYPLGTKALLSEILNENITDSRNRRNRTPMDSGAGCSSPASETEDTAGDRPEVILIRSPLPRLDNALASRFRLLRPSESPLPLDQFLTAHAGSVRALVISAYATLDAATLDLLPALRCVATTSVGVDNIDLAACARRAIAVANVGNIFSNDVADYAVGLLIDVLRRVSAAGGHIRGRMWPVAGDYPLGIKLGGKRVGIVGLGSIGSEIAKRLEVFGCAISYYSRNKKPSVHYTYYPSARDLAAQNDILIVSCALTSETRHIINKDVMSVLGKHGFIINVGRGALIDEEELVKCLVGRVIAGAGLDVFENEPAIPQELFSLDNVVLSPHAAVLTSESALDLENIVIANLEAFFSGRPLLTPIL